VTDVQLQKQAGAEVTELIIDNFAEHQQQQ